MVQTFTRLLFLACALLPTLLWAQPSNDNCTAPGTLTMGLNTGPIYTAVTTIGATASTPTASCAATSGNDDVWYEFVATAPTAFIAYRNFVVTGSASTSVGYALYDVNCPTTTTTLFCTTGIGVANAGSGTALIPVALVVGNTYKLRVFAQGVSNSANFDLAVFGSSPPVNDNCGGALPLPSFPNGACVFTSVSTQGASMSVPAAGSTCTAASTNDDVFFAFTANAPIMTLSFQNYVANAGPSTVVGAATTTGLGYTLFSGGCPGTGTALSCAFNLGGGASTGFATLGSGAAPLVIGTPYILVIYSQGGQNFATVDLCLSAAQTPPSNDQCATPLAATVSPANACTFFSVHTTGATYSGDDAAPNAPFCAPTSANDDVWYSFTATSTGLAVRMQNVVATAGVATNVGYAIYDACGGIRLDCFASRPADGTQVILPLTAPLVIGQTYYLRTWSGGSANFATYDFCLEAYTPQPPPVNDNCVGALALFGPGGTPTMNNGQPDSTSTATASSQPAQACAGFTGNADDDVWYTIDAQTAGSTLTITAVGAANFDGVLTLYTGACGSLSQVACADATADGGTETITFTTAFTGGGGGPSTAPTTYYLQVFDYAVGGGSFTLSATLAAPLPVELTRFSARAEGTRNVIEWAAATEQDLATYTVERADGADFARFAPVADVAPRGTNNGVEAVYSAYDNAPARVSYYRLKATDLDGSVDYSEVVAVTRTSGAPGVKLYPNPSPAGAAATIALSGVDEVDGLEVTVTDAAGRTVARVRYSADGAYELPLGGLPAGMYTVSSVSGAQAFTQRLVIQ